MLKTRQLQKPIALIFAMMANIALALLLVLQGGFDVSAAELPQYAKDKHMGVATCANSTCHDVAPHAALPANESNIQQNEYRTWLLNDRHAKAYTTLLSVESQRIARKLGLKSATTASICLDCHADNVPTEQQGPEFFVSDGVGCEACHGGSERWLSRHTLTPYNAQRNLDDGMYPTSPVKERMALCLSCHLGNEKKMATHDIMGAGHPRLGFELDTFTIRQPEHYSTDADYVERKQRETPLTRLLLGTALQAQAVSKNLSGSLVDHPQGHPELVLYDCHSCHHPMDDLRWEQRPSTEGLKPGAIRLNDSSFILLTALLAPIDAVLQQKMSDGIKRLHGASTRSIKELQKEAQTLFVLSQQAQTVLSDVELDDETKKAMVDSIVLYGIKGEYRDYIAAEQAVMGIDVLAYSLPLDPTLHELVERAYRHTKSQDAYNSRGFVLDLKSYLQTKQKTER